MAAPTMRVNTGINESMIGQSSRTVAKMKRRGKAEILAAWFWVDADELSRPFGDAAQRGG